MKPVSVGDAVMVFCSIPAETKPEWREGEVLYADEYQVFAMTKKGVAAVPNRLERIRHKEE